MLNNGFRETQLGPLPLEWDIVQLSDVATITMGQSPPSSTYNTDGDGLPFLQGKKEFGDTFPASIKSSKLLFCYMKGHGVKVCGG